MKKQILSLLAIATLFSCSNPYSGVSPEIAEKAKTAIASVGGERASELTTTLKSTPESQRQGMAYLIGNMPKYDLDTLPVAILEESVEYGYKAREEFSWAKEVSEEIFLNEVLPYSSMDETRELWRAEFYEMLKPVVKDAKTINEAIDTLNKALKTLVKVEYNTKRKKPNQSPAESMSQGMASCSGLSILLTDAFRAVGIPSRIAGTPMWVTREGNHNWSEVNINGEWLFAEYYFTPLNHSWFLAKAAMADPEKPETWIYATSFAQRDIHFPMVWNMQDKSIGGVDVTQRYRDTHAAQVKESKKGTPLSIKMYKNDNCTKTSADRVETNVKVKNSKGEVVGKGKTVGVNADMNDYLTVYIENLDDTYTIEWKGSDKLKTKKIKLSGPTTVDLVYE